VVEHPAQQGPFSRRLDDAPLAKFFQAPRHSEGARIQIDEPPNEPIELISVRSFRVVVAEHSPTLVVSRLDGWPVAMAPAMFDWPGGIPRRVRA
jgi:hypothetical protein